MGAKFPACSTRQIGTDARSASRYLAHHATVYAVVPSSDGLNDARGHMWTKETYRQSYCEQKMWSCLLLSLLTDTIKNRLCKKHVPQLRYYVHENNGLLAVWVLAVPVLTVPDWLKDAELNLAEMDSTDNDTLVVEQLQLLFPGLDIQSGLDAAVAQGAGEQPTGETNVTEPQGRGSVAGLKPPPELCEEANKELRWVQYDSPDKGKMWLRLHSYVPYRYCEGSHKCNLHVFINGWTYRCVNGYTTQLHDIIWFGNGGGGSQQQCFGPSWNVARVPLRYPAYCQCRPYSNCAWP